MMDARIEINGIGKRLRRLRNQHGYSRVYVADEIGYAAHTIECWELETFYPNALAVARLSEIYETSADYILKG